MKKILDKVIRIAKDAAKLYFNNEFKIYEKSNVSNIVTTNDINIQNYLIDKLSKVINNSGFFCEEEDIKDFSKEYIWIIDPIDGTTNYARGINESCISIGLYHNNEIVLGVIYIPSSDDLYYALKNYGAYHNNEKIKVSDKDFSSSLICIALSQYNKNYSSSCLDIISDVFYKCNDFRRFGSAAIELSMLAEGKIDLFFELRLYPWDYAAASLIVKEAHGIIKSFKSDITFNKPNLIIAANSEKNFNVLNDIILKHLKELPY